MKKLKRLAIIPARLGSQRIKQKNIKLFFGKPMIYYPITALKKSNIFDKIFVSTESNKIKKISKNLGADVDFLRPKSLSKDKITLKEVLLDVLKNFASKGQKFDEIWMVYACNPLLDSGNIIKAKNQFKKTNGQYPLISLKEYEAPIEWAFKKEKNFFKSTNKKKLYLDSKKIKKSFFECASFVIYKKKHISVKKNHYRYFGYILSNDSAVDIDNKNDWNHALSLFKIKNNVKI